MRFQGKLTDWKDDKGYGFIVQNGGGERVFVHIRDFAAGPKRPTGNEIVTYEIGTDPKGRIPSDRTFRNAWTLQDGLLGHDMTKCMDLTKSRLRAARKPLLEAQDVLLHPWSNCT